MHHVQDRPGDHFQDPLRGPLQDPLDFESGLARDLRIGDAVLVGGSDPVSRFIQLGTQSKYSHMAVVTGPDELTEAYDYALTPDEDDEGIYRLSFSDFMNRSAKVKRLLVLRPHGIDERRLVAAADHLLSHSPGFPTLVAACLAFCGLSVPLLRTLPAETRRRLAQWQVRLATDGVSRVHCAEAATRMYAYAGLQIRFTAPRMQYHINYLRQLNSSDQLLPLPSGERTAVKGSWPTGLHPATVSAAVSTALRDSIRVAGQRARSTEPVDRADLVMPGDFVRAEPFTTVGHFVRTRQGWTEAA